ncbi:MAB_1171c family putative transporter [Arthrobacter zhaoguopingii]|uniref:MAB_1171c family putative transporter n=1 Tax=Arthrobacter zhaoguopingii TaxID=2681491 RepID=UPI00135CB5BD|nr:MAB_1171c family putative transporter [Arthrobacter zhaoguopingii]
MIQLFVAAMIWGLVLCLLPRMKRRSDHSVMAAAVTIATALTLNVDVIYLEGDRLLGARNILDLVSNIFLVVGIFFLSQAVLRAADPGETSQRRNRVGLIFLGLVGVALIISFSLVDASRTSTSFMEDFGSQWAAAAYSSIQFLYLGAVVTVTGYTCFKFRGEMARPYFRLALTFIGIGCCLAVVLVLAVLGMNVLHLMGEIDPMRRLSYVYDAALFGAMTFLCIGLAMPPVARGLEHRSDSRTAAVLLDRLAEPWERITAARAGVRLNVSAAGCPRDVAKQRLHRTIVEIQDALLVDPELVKSLGEGDIHALAEAEAYLGTRESRPGQERVGTSIKRVLKS